MSPTAEPPMQFSAMKKFRRALPSLAIASICFSLIYLDYSHTQKWKKEVETQKELIEKAKATA